MAHKYYFFNERRMYYPKFQSLFDDPDIVSYDDKMYIPSETVDFFMQALVNGLESIRIASQYFWLTIIEYYYIARNQTQGEYAKIRHRSRQSVNRRLQRATTALRLYCVEEMEILLDE